jgi:S1-C subfamily serine protease
MVVSAAPGSPADTAGVLIGDIIVAADDTSLSDLPDLLALLGAGQIGKTVTLRIIRGGEPRTVPAVVGERPQQRSARRSR